MMQNEDLFFEALKQSPSDRGTFLDEKCRNQPQQRQRVEALLAAHERPDELLDADATANFEHDDAATPAAIGDFELIRELGRGGMGVVYEARQKSLKRKVALKVLSSRLGLGSKAILRFRREAEAAGRLHHTNIVPIYTTGHDRGVHFYAMELVDGPSLDLVINRLTVNSRGDVDADGDELPNWVRETVLSPKGETDPTHRFAAESHHPSYNASQSSISGGSHYFDQIASMIAEVADALEHAHEHGVIHRDIKPSNLLLGPDGRLSVNDFGLARMLEQPGVTMSGEFVGSPLYMSPEQVTAGRVSIDHRTDIYSLGATLYELLALRPPFPGRSRDQVLSQILQKEAVSPRRFNRKIPLDLDTICMKAIDKDPDQRYQQAGQLAEDLRKYVNRHAISARRIGLLGKGLRLAQRNPVVTALASCLILCIGLSSWGGTVWWSEKLRDSQKNAIDSIIVGRIEKADADVELAKSWGADDGWYFRNKGHIELLRGDLDQSDRYLKLAESAGDSSVPLACLQALSKFYGSHEQDYFRDCNTLLEISTSPTLSIEDRFYIGIALEWGNPKAALQLLSSVEKEMEQSAAVTLSLGSVKTMRAMDEPDVERALSLIDGAIQDLETCLRYWPENTKVHAMLTEANLAAFQFQKQRSNPAEADRHLVAAKKYCESISYDSNDSINGLTRYYYLQYADGFDFAAKSLLRQFPNLQRRNNYLASYAIIDAFRLGEPASAEEAYARLNESLPREKSGQLIRSTKRSFLEIARLSTPTTESERAELLHAFQNYLSDKSMQNDFSNFEEDWLALRLLGASPEAARKHAAKSEGFFRSFNNPMQRDLVPLCDYLASEDPDDDDLIEYCESRDSKRLKAAVHFCIGVRALAEGRRADARRHFQYCVDQHEFHLFVYQWSSALRDKIDREPDWPAWIE
ncbi:MAG: serine/threonine-protein kinase [Planctomycetota bacterium]